MRLLVTGSAGWIGSAAVEVLGRSHWLHCADLNQSPTPANGESVIADLGDWTEVEAAVVGVDAVLHLAHGGNPDQQTPASMIHGTVAATVNSLEAAKRAGIGRFVLVSSGAVVTGYPVGTRITAETPLRCEGLYPLSKALQEAAARQCAEAYRMTIQVLRQWVVVDAASGRYRFGDPLTSDLPPYDHNGVFGWIDRFGFAEACRLAVEAPLAGSEVFHLFASPLGRRVFDVERSDARLGWCPRIDFAAFTPPDTQPLPPTEVPT